MRTTFACKLLVIVVFGMRGREVPMALSSLQACSQDFASREEM